MKGRFLISLAILLLLRLCSLKASTPNGSLMMPVQFIIENGNYVNSVVDVKKNGESVLNQGGQQNLHLRLQYGNDYILSFSKPGYITKKVRVNTVVPAEHGKQGFEPYKIGVRLYKQYDGVNTVVYNQPVAYICYQNESDAFGYDTDYTKSILSVLTETENKLEEKAKEERALLKMQSIKSSDLKTKREKEEDGLSGSNSIKNNSRIIESPSSSSEVLLSSTIQTLNQKPNNNAKSDSSGKNKPASGNDLLGKTTLNAGNETPPVSAGANGVSSPPGETYFEEGQDTIHFSSSTNLEDIPVVHVKRRKTDPAAVPPLSVAGDVKNIQALKPVGEKEILSINSFHQKGEDAHIVASAEAVRGTRTIEKKIEANRIITSIAIQSGSHVMEYSRIDYNWGGVYFFVNKTIPISEHLFNYFTGE
jgi:hypothetical protein